MIGVGRFLRSRFLKRLIQRDAGNEPRPQEAANVQFSHRLVRAGFSEFPLLKVRETEDGRAAS